VKSKGRCSVVGCKGKLNAKDRSTENVCGKHILTAIRFDNINVVCHMRSCTNKARSSGYFRKHSPDEYHQRVDLLPENGHGNENSVLFQALSKAQENINNEQRMEQIEKGRRR